MEDTGHTITIDIKRVRDYALEGTGEVVVEKEDGTAYTYNGVPSGYTKCKHAPKDVKDGECFMVKHVIYGDSAPNTISAIATPMDNVKSFIAYYWTVDENNPLLIKLEKLGDNSGIETLWYENVSRNREDNTTWSPITNPSHLSRGDLTTKLDEVNCTVNNVVQIELPKTHGSYCHYGHNGRISVTNMVPRLNFERYKVYLHSANTDNNPAVTISIFTNHIPQNGFDTPIYGVSDVVVFLERDSPQLVYILPNKVWYRRRTSLENQEPWVKEESRLKTLELSELDEDKVKEIIKVLKEIRAEENGGNRRRHEEPRGDSVGAIPENLDDHNDHSFHPDHHGDHSYETNAEVQNGGETHEDERQTKDSTTPSSAHTPSLEPLHAPKSEEFHSHESHITALKGPVEVAVMNDGDRMDVHNDHHNDHNGHYDHHSKDVPTQELKEPNLAYLYFLIPGVILLGGITYLGFVHFSKRM